MEIRWEYLLQKTLITFKTCISPRPNNVEFTLWDLRPRPSSRLYRALNAISLMSNPITFQNIQ